MTVDRVVLPVSGAANEVAAIGRGVALARRLGVPTVLVRQIAPAASEAERAAVVEQMERLAATASAHRPEIRVVGGDLAAPAIVHAVEDDPAALVCLRTHARDALGQLLWGSVSVEVARRSPVPVLLLGPAVPAATDAAAPTHLLVLVDGSEAADRAVAPAVALAADLGVPVVLASVGTTDAPLPAAHLEDLGARLGAEVVTTEAAGAAEGILGLLRERPSAWPVMATHARRVGRRFEEGSVVLDVVAASPVPVLVIGPRCSA